MTDSFDLVVVGGGINGCGIACDAAGRGLSVLLAEMGDLAGATSSASSKLIHGGLRYLEHYEFRLVREALGEREVLLRKAPHIIWPLRFVLPHVPGRRPRWMIRTGLFLYDHLYRRAAIPGSKAVDLTSDPAGRALAPSLRQGFSYHDCWVDDARLVLLNAQMARDKGAEILTRTRVTAITPADGAFRVALLAGNVERIVHARALINAAGPWADRIDGYMAAASIDAKPPHIRLIKGSHIVVPRIAGMGEDAYLMQNADGRVVFLLPFEERFTIIGTTDVPYAGDPAAVAISSDEEQYLLDLARGVLKAPLQAADIVWRYSGVRPLYDDHSDDPSAVTRDYRLETTLLGGAPRVSVYGGKVTTYRRLAEEAVDRLAPTFPGLGPAWTATATLPGGDLPAASFEAFVDDLARRYPAIDRRHLIRIARRQGAATASLLGDARTLADLGMPIGEGLTEREVAWMKAREWARTPEDVLWRRSKLGLHIRTSAGPEALARAEAAIAARL
jgi:glycerol-3-phosphate dehydrogenase